MIDSSTSPGYSCIRMETRYPIRAVARITGISLDTLRAWERRYKAVVPERSARGRQYGSLDIERLRLLHELVQRGHAIGGIAGRTDAELRDLIKRQSNQPKAEEGVSANDLLAPVFSAIERFDVGRATDEVNRLAAAMAPRDLVYQVALPLMREVGERWHNGKLTIAQEHLVSEILRNLLGSMLRLFRSSGTNGSMATKMIFATPSGETHEFGILSSAMLASMAGMEPVYLGPDLPGHEIAEAAKRVSADVVVLGVTVLSETTAREIKAIAEQIPEGAELWIGGASSDGLDLSGLGRKTVFLKDLAALEDECRLRRN